MLSKLNLIAIAAFLFAMVPSAQAKESVGDAGRASEQDEPYRWETRHQFFDFNLGFGLYGAYGNMKFIKLRWERSYWQVLRMSTAFPVHTHWGGGSIGIGTEAGGAIRLDERTELLIGLGVEVGASIACYNLDDCGSDITGPAIPLLMMVFWPKGIYLTPGVTLSKHISDHFALNFGVEVNIFSGIYLEHARDDLPYPVPNVAAFIGFTI